MENFRRGQKYVFMLPRLMTYSRCKWNTCSWPYSKPTSSRYKWHTFLNSFNKEAFVPEGAGCSVDGRMTTQTPAFYQDTPGWGFVTSTTGVPEHSKMRCGVQCQRGMILLLNKMGKAWWASLVGSNSTFSISDWRGKNTCFIWTQKNYLTVTDMINIALKTMDTYNLLYLFQNSIILIGQLG